MRWEMVVHEGLPDREGNFLYIADYGEGLDIRTIEFIPEYGWNATRNSDGEVIDKFVFTNLSNYKGWAEIRETEQTTVEILQDLHEKAEALSDGDPANHGDSYRNEDEIFYWSNVAELEDHLRQALGYAKTLEGDI